MAPEEFVELVKKGPTDKMVAALAPLTEAQRKKLSKHGVELRKEVARSEAERAKSRIFALREPPTAPIPCPFCGKMLRTATAQQCFECGKDWHDVNQVREVPTSPWYTQADSRLKLALMAVGPWGEAQRIRVWSVAPGWHKRQDAREQLFQVLRDRKPEWLAKWVERELDQQHLGDWGFVRRLVRANLCPKPQSENYIARMVWGVYSADRAKTLKDMLLDDPDLLTDEVWRVFELNPARGSVLGGMAPRDTQPGSWSGALLALSQEGRLDRQRLLEASLQGLSRNREQRNTVWFAGFHEMLEPAAAERDKLQSTYLQLLGHPVPAVVGLALDALAGLDKAGTLDVPGFLDAIAPVFFLKPKAQPLAALKILRRVSVAHQQHTPKLAEVLLAGLTHSAVQVQQGILDVLASASPQTAEVIAAALPDRIDQLAPSVQESARQLLNRGGGSAPAIVAADQAHESREVNLDESIAAARAIPAPWREAAGIDAVLQALDEGGELQPLAFDPMRVPRLDPEKSLAPIATLDELIQRLTVAIEGLDDPIEFELLADGLSRLCDQRPDDFEARVSPVLHRLRQIISPNQRSLPAGISLTVAALGLRALLFKLVLRWCEQDVPAGKTMGEDRNDILAFLTVRMDALALRIRKRLAAPLLACPTHRPAWIDPAEMARRLACHQDHGVEPDAHDFIQAMLRIAPDGRAAALAAARVLRGGFAAAFRYGLGGPLEDSALPQSWLIAAGRARAPFAELTELDASADSLGPDARQPARYSWRVEHSRPEDQKHWARLYVSTQLHLPARDKIGDVPTVLLHAGRNSRGFDWPGGGINGLNRWEATVWPADLDSFFMVGASLRPGQYFEAATLRQRAAYLEPLFDPDVPFSEMAQLLVALSLLQKEPEVAGLAVDALIELIRDGRCTGSELGYVLGRMVPTELVKLNRLAKQLDACAAASLLHKHVCARIAQDACADLTEVPKDLHTLLGPLLEWLTALDQGVRAEFRPLLEKAKSGKTALLAKRLLARTSSPGKCMQILAEALAGRLERAGRWSLTEQANLALWHGLPTS